jgi:Zn-dependent protease with chaperone function
MADAVNWYDAAGDNVLAIGLFVPGSQDYQMQQQHGPNETISQYVSGGTKAAAALPGSPLWGNIYFSSSFVAGLPTSSVAGLLMHELSHTLGATDTQIQAALFGAGSPQVGAPSDNITQKFVTDCFR